MKKPTAPKPKRRRCVPQEERDAALSDLLDIWFLNRANERRGTLADRRFSICFAGFKRQNMIEGFDSLRDRYLRLQAVKEPEEGAK